MPSEVAIGPGTRIGPYEVTSPLGEGKERFMKCGAMPELHSSNRSPRLRNAVREIKERSRLPRRTVAP
jgi:hypothetical protein